MILPHDVSIVIQGDVRSNTKRLLHSLRRQMPRARLIFATVDNGIAAWVREDIRNCVDCLCVTDDPGPLPATVDSPAAPPNNINRMLRSTQLGLAKVDTPYVLKLRSDAECDVGAIIRGWLNALGTEPPELSPRLAFASLYTRHPHGISGYAFHVSDWMTFGRSATVSDYWSAPCVTSEQARWFDNHPVPPNLTAIARRFRAILSQEQWVCVHYAGRKGYEVPSMVHDRRAEVIAAYERFLAKECVILDVGSIDMRVPKQAWASRSIVQDLDCVSHDDWLAVSGRTPVDRKRQRRRALARQHRHLIAFGALFRKWVIARWTRAAKRRPKIDATPSAELPSRAAVMPINPPNKRTTKEGASC